MMMLPWALLWVLLPTSRTQQQQVLHIEGSSASPTKLISPQTEQYVRTLLTRWNSSGLSIAVVKKDDSAPSGWRHEFGGYGVARADGTQVTPDTLFSVASNSKLFLAVSMGLLVSNKTLAQQRGSDIKWTTKVRDLIPEWGLMDETMDRGTTLQDMLSHRTGLPRHDFSGLQRPGGVREMISTLRYLRPSAEFRETFQYSNLMYETLSYLPSVLLNQSYESYIDQHIFKPLNMSSSTFSVAEAEQRPTMAQGFLWDDRDVTKGRTGTLRPTIPYFQRPGEELTWAGAGGIITSARDLAVWVSTLLNGGRNIYTNVSVIPQEIIDHVATGRTVSGGAPEFPELSPKVYGAGQWRYSYQGHDLIEHGGNNFGFKSQVARFPDENLGIITLSNDGNGGFLLEAAKFRIADELLGLKQIDWNERYEKLWGTIIDDAQKAITPRPNPPKPPTQPFPLLASATYTHPAYGILQPCLVPRTISNLIISSPMHQECTNLLSSYPVQRILAVSNLSIPSFIIPWKRTFATHVLLAHFNENLFNVTVLWNNAEVREREGYNTSGNQGGDILMGHDEHFEVEWLEDGLAFKGGIWGKEGPDSRSPTGIGKDSAEIWFQKSV